jgi:hypothetical protein
MSASEPRPPEHERFSSPFIESRIGTVADARAVERRLCSCGVVQMFGGETWAVQHAAKCPAGGIVADALRKGLR